MRQEILSKISNLEKQTREIKQDLLIILKEQNPDFYSEFIKKEQMQE